MYIVHIRRGVVFLWYIDSLVDVQKGALKFRVPHLTIYMLVSFCLYVFLHCCHMVTIPMTILSILLGLCICQKSSFVSWFIFCVCIHHIKLKS